MLRSTFQHIPGVGESSERQLWRAGCTRWEHILNRDYGLSCNRYKRVKAGVLESMARLDNMDHRYFSVCLGHRLSWRAYETFRDRACFLDIETTGLYPGRSHVTVACVHSKENTKTYIAGENMEDLGRDLKKFSYIVTFNGARFDLPFLSADLGISFDQIHFDLVYACRRLGLCGGLKTIEKQIGVGRETQGITGYDAVRLWDAYVNDREVEVTGQTVDGAGALGLLVRYNREDTVNMEKLVSYVIRKLMDGTPFLGRL